MQTDTFIRPIILESCHQVTATCTRCSLYFTYDRVCMKLLKIQILIYRSLKKCPSYFRSVLPSITIKERPQKFLSKYDNSDNTFRRIKTVSLLFCN